MADFYSTARSEDFRVRDPQALRADLAAWGVVEDVEVHETSGAPDGTVYLIARTDKGDWPSFEPDWVADRLGWYDLDEDELDARVKALPHAERVARIEDLVAAHLVDGEVAVLMSVGHEKMRYVDGWAVAINAAGESRQVALSDIHELAKELAGPRSGDG